MSRGSHVTFDPHELLYRLVRALADVFRWANAGGKLFIIGVFALAFGAIFRAAYPEEGGFIVGGAQVAVVLGLVLAVAILIYRLFERTNR